MINNKLMNKDFNSCDVLMVVSREDLKSVVAEAVSEAIAKKEPEGEATLITRAETATKNKVSLPTLWRWEKEGHLKPKRMGRKVYYSEQDIKKTMEG